VDEATWLACVDPVAMYDFVGRRLSHRKQRLFACAWARHVWPRLHDPRSHRAVEVAEKVAEGVHSKEEFAEARTGTQQTAGEWPAHYCVYEDPGSCIVSVVKPHAADDVPQDMEVQAALLREIAGNPFRPFAWDDEDRFGPVPVLVEGTRPRLLRSEWMAWNGGTVALLAQSAYEDRRLPSGHFDVARLLVLADALEEAGCTHADLLAHVHSPGPHVRGCWAVDLLCGKW
jgi:hypothetical protein